MLTCTYVHVHAYTHTYIQCTYVHTYIHTYTCRYSREEPFTAINVDIRLHHNLFESLDSYVKGDLLEGANAYLCEKCDKKVSL